MNCTNSTIFELVSLQKNLANFLHQIIIQETPHICVDTKIMIILLITGIPSIFGLLFVMCLKCGCLDCLTYDWRFGQTYKQTESEMESADYLFKRRRYVRYTQLQLEDQDSTDEDFVDFVENRAREILEH